MNKVAAFNWKMNPGSLKEAKKLFDCYMRAESRKLKSEAIVCPPFVYLIELENSRTQELKNLKLGAQDAFWMSSGAYTGEISPKMLKNLGVEYVIIGHSERRRYLNETDETINKKVLAVLKAGLKVILCVGENLPLRRRGKRAVEELIKSQLKNDLKDVKNLKLKAKNLAIAYEPVWAIGTGVPCRPEDALEMIKFIKQFLKTTTYNLTPKVLYGGSVDGNNVGDFVKYKEIDGVLVGGASLKKNEIKKIIKAVNNYSPI